MAGLSGGTIVIGQAGIVRALSRARQKGQLRILLVAFTGAMLLFAAWEAWIFIPEALSGEAAGLDLHLYLERARSWLAGSGFYQPHQLTGSPYEIELGDALYPPSLLYLLVPATVLPQLVWWLIPAVVVGYAVWRHRPSLLGWTYIALTFCWPRTWQSIVFGNPVIWVVAAVAAGTLWSWPYIGAFLKPTFGFFGLLGARSRSWWIALGVALLAALPLWPMWFDYASALVNARIGSTMPPDYLWGELPLVALPVIVRLARRPATSAGVASGAPAGPPSG